MRVQAKIKEFTNNDLRVLSFKTGKSVKELKRLRKTKFYLVYNSSNAAYGFLGTMTYLVQSPNKSPEEFFETIQEYQLSQML